MKMDILSRELYLKHTFTIAHQSRDMQETLLVVLTDGNHLGLGEATTNPFYGMTLENMTATLETVQKTVEKSDWEHPQQLWDMTKIFFNKNSFAQCALDMAAWDLYAKKQNQKLYELLDLNINNIPVTNYTIGIAPIEKMIAKIKEVNWPLYKIKLGTAHDMEIIRELRNNTDAVFRIDANCAWTAKQAIQYSEELIHLNVEFMEQPLGKDDFEGMRQVYKYSRLPIIADESCMVEEDVVKCKNHFHGINIKLVKAGGITPCLRMLQQAKAFGMKTMVGCMIESSIGISAIAHIAPLLDYVDMDGAMLLAEDIASGVTIHSDGVIFPDRNGIGAILI